jgi:hypothetical protein
MVFGRGTRAPAAAGAVRTSGMADPQLIGGDHHGAPSPISLRGNK